jgi:hypothetical protein
LHPGYVEQGKSRLFIGDWIKDAGYAGGLKFDESSTRGGPRGRIIPIHRYKPNVVIRIIPNLPEEPHVVVFIAFQNNRVRMPGR